MVQYIQEHFHYAKNSIADSANPTKINIPQKNPKENNTFKAFIHKKIEDKMFFKEQTVCMMKS